MLCVIIESIFYFLFFGTLIVMTLMLTAEPLQRMLRKIKRKGWSKFRSERR